jgi:hypothetical protein
MNLLYNLQLLFLYVVLVRFGEIFVYSLIKIIIISCLGTPVLFC